MGLTELTRFGFSLFCAAIFSWLFSGYCRLCHEPDDDICRQRFKGRRHSRRAQRLLITQGEEWAAMFCEMIRNFEYFSTVESCHMDVEDLALPAAWGF